jgi:hypothetical protein
MKLKKTNCETVHAVTIRCVARLLVGNPEFFGASSKDTPSRLA